MRPLHALMVAAVLTASALPAKDTLYVSGPATPGASPYSLYDISQEVNEAFLKKHPSYALKHGSILRLTGQLSMDAMSMAISAGTAPDIFRVSLRNYYKYVDNGFVAPLDDYIKDLPYRKSDRYLDPRVIKMLSYKDKTWFLPVGNPSYTVMFYRKDLFQEAGLTHPPADWDEMFEYAQKLTDPAKDQWGYGMFGSPETPNSWRLINFLWQSGTKIFTETSVNTLVPAFNTPEGVTALKFYRKLLHHPWQKDGRTIYGVARIDHWKLWDYFREGKYAMVFGNISGLIFPQDYDPELYSVAPLPAGPSGIRANMLNQGLIGINATISPERRKRAWEYIRFLVGPEAQEISIRRHVEAGFGKYLPPDLLRQYGYERYIEKIPEEWRETYRITKASAIPEPHLDGLYAELDKVTYKVATLDTVAYAAVLDEAAAKVETRLRRWLMPGEQVKRRITGFTFLAVLIMVIAGFFIRFRRSLAALFSAQGRRRRFVFFKNRHATAWTVGMIAPALLTMFLWYYIPMVRSMHIASLDYRIIGASTSVGIDNFVFALWNPEFWQAFFNSLVYVFMTVVLGFLSPVILALLLDEIPVGKLWFRLAFYLPAVMSTLVITMLWLWFYDPAEEGFFNTILHLMELPAQSWLQDTRLAMLCVVIPGVWSTVGAGSIIYLAALKNVPVEMYEQASIDGAGITGRIMNITFHYLKPLLVIQLLGTVIGGFHATQRILVMTGGGPLRATTTLGLDIFTNAFYAMRYGYATALAWILGSFIIGFTLFQLRILRQSRVITGSGD